MRPVGKDYFAIERHVLAIPKKKSAGLDENTFWQGFWRRRRDGPRRRRIDDSRRIWVCLRESRGGQSE